ncbi:MAG: NAD-dependent epimerase/dehydratase family protein [Polyangiaceae bacterium]
MKVLVTGAAGFIGSHLMERLLARGDDAVGLDWYGDNYPPSIKRQNAAAFADRVVEGDILNVALLDDLFAKHDFEAVVHLAALPGVRPSIAEPGRYQAVNVEGTAQIVDAMHRAGVKRLVFASSSSVYGRNEERPYRETDRVDQPASPYASSKRAGELLLTTLHPIFQIGVTSLRYFTVYGPRQRPEMAIHKFVKAVEEGTPIPMFGNGETSRDYTYVDDIIDGTVAALDRCDERFRIYNLGDNRPVTLRELIDKVGEAVGKEPIIEELEEQAGDVQHTLACIDQAAADLGYAPKVPIEEGLRRFVDWYRAQEA